jgi:hypothetical protein
MRSIVENYVCKLHDYLTNIIIYYRRHIRSWVNYMTILLTLLSTIDVTLGPELITWLSYKD